VRLVGYLKRKKLWCSKTSKTAANQKSNDVTVEICVIKYLCK